MGKSWFKDFFREIWSTKNRFLSILAITFLGAAFFGGISVTTPDFKQTANAYYEDNHLADFQLLSTLGIAEEDVAAFIKQKEDLGLDVIYPTHTLDVLVNHGTPMETAIKLLSYDGANQPLNDFILVEGRMPEAANECVVDISTHVPDNFQLGQSLTMTAGNPDETLDDSLENTTFTVVGKVQSPLYINFNRGSTTIGTGTLDGFVVIPAENFKGDYYTNLFLTVAGARGLDAFGKDYTNFMEQKQTTLEAFWKQRVEARYHTLKADGEAELADAKAELAKAEEELETELASGRKELDDAKAQLEQGRKELEDGKAQLAKAEADGLAELQNAQKQLEKAEATLKEQEAQYQKGKAEFDKAYPTALKQLEDGEKELTAQKKTAEAEFAKAEAQLTSAKEELSQGKAQLEAGKEQLTAAKTQLDQGKEQLAQARAQLEASQSVLPPELYQAQLAALTAKEQELEAQLAAWQQSQAQLTAQEQALHQSETQLTAQESQFAKEKQQAQAQMEQAQKQLTDGKAELAKQKDQLEEAGKALADGKAQLAQGKQDLDAGYATYYREMEKSKAQLQQAEAELVQGEAEYQQGEADYAEGKAEGEKAITDAKAELADGEAELAKLEEPDWYVWDREENVGYSDFINDVDIVQNVARVFPYFFILIAMLVCLTTMTRLIEERRTQIGTMKALGYGNGVIATKYLGYAGLATLLGCVIGLALGGVLFPLVIFFAYRTMYNFPSIALPIHWGLYGICVGIGLAAMLLTTLFACYKVLYATPATLMRPKAPPAGKKILLERWKPVWKKIPFAYKLLARNLFRYKKRAIMTIVGVGGCTALMLTGFGMQYAVTSIADTQFQQVMTFDAIVSLQDGLTQAEQEQAFADIGAMDGVTSALPMELSSVTVVGSGGKRDANLFVPESVQSLTEYVNLHTREGHAPLTLSNDGLIFSEKLAKLCGVSVGDAVTLTLDGEQREAKVAGIHENYIGDYVFASPSYFQRIFGMAPTYNAALLNTAGPEVEEALSTAITENDLLMGASFQTASLENFRSIIQNMNSVVYLIILSAGALAFIVLYNLVSINVAERQRELATLKVLGYRDGETSAYIYRENIVCSIVGILAGLFAGVFLERFVVRTAETDVAMFSPDIPFYCFLFAGLLTFAFTLVVNIFVHIKLKRLDMVESLKSVE